MGVAVAGVSFGSLSSTSGSTARDDFENLTRAIHLPVNGHHDFAGRTGRQVNFRARPASCTATSSTSAGLLAGMLSGNTSVTIGSSPSDSRYQMFVAAVVYQVAHLHDVAAIGRHGKRQQGIGGAAEIVVVGQGPAGGVEQRQDYVGLGTDFGGGDLEHQLLTGPGVEGKVVGVAPGRQHAPGAGPSATVLAVAIASLGSISSDCGRLSTLIGRCALSPALLTSQISNCPHGKSAAGVTSISNSLRVVNRRQLDGQLRLVRLNAGDPRQMVAGEGQPAGLARLPPRRASGESSGLGAGGAGISLPSAVS